MTDEPEYLTCFNGDMGKARAQFIREWDCLRGGPAEGLGSAISYLLADIEAGLAAAPRAKCRVCNGKGYHAGDPEGAAIEGCSDCLGTGFQVNEDEGSKIDLAFVCAGLSAADKRSVVERILALGSRIDQLEAAAPRAGVVESLFAAIAHGDADHRAWLEGAIADHFAGRPVERPPAVPDPHAEVVAAAYAYREAKAAWEARDHLSWTETGVAVTNAQAALLRAAAHLPDRDGGAG